MQALQNGNPEVAERFVILGRVGAGTFVPWIVRHAGRLGIEAAVEHHGEDRVEVRVAGPLALVDAMELGCSLGPIEVWVEGIERAPVDDASAG